MSRTDSSGQDGLRAAVEALVFESSDGTEREHNGHARWEGEPECPGCWAESLRGILAEHPATPTEETACQWRVDAGLTPCCRHEGRNRWECITWPDKSTAYACGHDHAHCDFIGCVEHIDGMHVDFRGDAIVHLGCDLCRSEPTEETADLTGPEQMAARALAEEAAEVAAEVACTNCGDEHSIDVSCSANARLYDQTAEVADEDRDALAEIVCPCGHGIQSHTWAGCISYVPPRIGRVGACCTKTPTDVVLASNWLRDHDAALTANAKAEVDDLRARLAKVEALAEEAWVWTAPVGPGNASYANGYENGRRSLASDIRTALSDVAEGQ